MARGDLRVNPNTGACAAPVFLSAMNGFLPRPLLVALLLSLGMHLSLLLPWRYGEFLASGMLNGRTVLREHARLNATLMHSTSTPVVADSRNTAPVRLPTEMAVQQPPSAPMALPPVPSPIPASTETSAGVALDGLYYYSIKELDQRPMLKRQPIFDAPANTELVANGSAILELLIERDGRVNAVNIVRTDLLEVHLAPLRKSFASVEYTPGIKHAQAARSRIYIEVAYIDGVVTPVTPSPSVVRNSSPEGPLQLPSNWRERLQNPPRRSSD